MTKRKGFSFLLILVLLTSAMMVPTATAVPAGIEAVP
jgi:hypothetical protein